MKTIKQYPSQSILKELFDYNNGHLYVKQLTSIYSNKNIGDRVGSYQSDYAKTSINRVSFQVHRLVYIWHHGEIPTGLLIDHIDGNPHNNDIDNLQLATDIQNAQKKRLQRNSSTGTTGVTFHKLAKKWQAMITVDKKQLHLGYFDEFIDAVTARKSAQLNHFGSFQPIQ